MVHCSLEGEASRCSSGLKYCKDLKSVHRHALLHLLHAGPAPHQVVLYLLFSSLVGWVCEQESWNMEQ